jgi:transketolase
MRVACAPVLESIAEEARDVVALGADGQAIFTALARRFPERFIDVGVAEANLVGVAAGMARAGRRVFVATIASFLLRRAYDQIYNDVCIPNLPVKLIGIGGGLSYGVLGPTHLIPEDIALARLLPNTAVFVPADAVDARGAVRAALDWPGPAYVRLGAAADPLIHELEGPFVPGRPEVLRPGRDVTIFATGACVAQALWAGEQLREHGVDAGVANVHTFHPVDDTSFLELARGRQAVLSVEEHVLPGGLGSLLAELLAVPSGPSAALVRLGVSSRHPPVGSRDDLIRYYGLDGPSIVRAACRALGRG